jgi:heat shock protein HslJ
MACKSQKDKTPHASLEGEWTLVSLNDTLVSEDLKRTIAFEASEKDVFRVSGNAGCNRYFGSMTAVNNMYYNFNQFGMTKMACLDMTPEQEFMKYLTASNYYVIDKSELTLYDLDKLFVMKFKKEK